MESLNTKNSKISKRGFSLIELLLYVGILAITSGLLVSILLTTTRVQISETTSNEVNSQLNFTLQTIQRLVRESSNIETVGINNIETDPDVTELVYMKLRMEDPLLDPTCISQVENSIRITQGPQSTYPNDRKCKKSNHPDNIYNITTDKVKVPKTPTPGLEIVKYSNPPAHDSVQIDLTLSYSPTNPQAQVTRTLQSAVGRASAATFDSDLLPGATGIRNIGQPTTRWLNGYFGGDVEIDGFLQFKASGSEDPPIATCDPSKVGRLYLKNNAAPFKLYICSGSAGWKSATLN
jgi:type II secretory pathway pseudopilin PulG